MYNHWTALYFAMLCASGMGSVWNKGCLSLLGYGGRAKSATRQDGSTNYWTLFCLKWLHFLSLSGWSAFALSPSCLSFLFYYDFIRIVLCCLWQSWRLLLKNCREDCLGSWCVWTICILMVESQENLCQKIVHMIKSKEEVLGYWHQRADERHSNPPPW